MIIDRILRYGEAAAGLALGIYRAVREGRTERVAAILPEELLTTIERTRAEVDAINRYGGEQ